MIQRFILRGVNLTKRLSFNYIDEWDQHRIKPFNIPVPPQYKKQLNQDALRPFPKVRYNYYDCLSMPGLDRERLLQMQRQLLIKKEVGLSNQFVALLLYQLSKQKIMLKQVMNILQEWIPRHKGEYTSREIFGCLYGSIIYNRMDHVQFFMDEIAASELKFKFSESLEIVQALNKNTQMSLEEKHAFWERTFKNIFIDRMHLVKSGHMPTVFRIFDAFYQFQYFQDEQIWDQIFTMMDRKGGWVRTKIIERLYPLTGTFERAKQLFDKYYMKLSTNSNIIWRYNLQELRMYTSEQMIAKSQDNIQMYPTFRTLLPHDRLNKLTEKYERWLVSGAVKEEQQIIRDKSASFGYAIQDRFESLTKDNVDFSKMTKAEFEQLFGEYDEEMMKEKEQTGEEQVVQEGEEVSEQEQ